MARVATLRKYECGPVEKGEKYSFNDDAPSEDSAVHMEPSMSIHAPGILSSCSHVPLRPDPWNIMKHRSKLICTA